VDLREIYDSEAQSEFKTGSLDPSWRFDVKEDGHYRLEIRDLFNSQSDPRRSIDYRFVKSLLICPGRLAAACGPPKKDSKEAAIVFHLRTGRNGPLKSWLCAAKDLKENRIEGERIAEVNQSESGAN